MPGVPTLAKKSGQFVCFQTGGESADLQTLLFSHADGVATLTLDRPRRLNALNRTMLDEIQVVLDEVKKNDVDCVVVVTGAMRASRATPRGCKGVQ
jgi:1,4-dihydroxy-2-naphthoyl-CoA synthase